MRRAWMMAAGLLLAGLSGCVSPEDQEGTGGESVGRNCPDTGTTTGTGGEEGIEQDDATRAGDNPPDGATGASDCPDNAAGTTGAGQGPGEVAPT